MKLKRNQAGNVTLLMLSFCILCLLITIAMMDIFLILFVRRSTQTAADSAAFGALRAIQPAVSEALWHKTQARLDTYGAEIDFDFSRAMDVWHQVRSQSYDICKTAATTTTVLSEGPPPVYQEVVDQASFQQCTILVDQSNPSPSRDAIAGPYLTARISDQVVLHALRHGGTVAPKRLVQAILTPREQLCTIRDLSPSLRAVAMEEAAKYASWNGAELVGVILPFQDMPVVYVAVERKVPTIIFKRYIATEIKASRSAAATLLAESERVPIPGACVP